LPAWFNVGVAREKILLVRLSALGDVVQCLAALASLRAARPDAEIGWLVEDAHAGVLAGHPHVDRLFVWQRRSGALGAARRVRREVRGWRPDVAVDLQGNLKSALLARGCGARRRVGLAKGEAREGAHLFSTERAAPGVAGEHRSDRAMRLVRLVGARDDVPPALPPVRPDAEEAVRAGLAAAGVAAGGYALLLPGTSDFGAFKRWPSRRFGALAQRIARELRLAPLVAFGPGQRALADDVVGSSQGAARLAPATGDLHQLLALLRGAALVVGADSGPVVLASALGVATVALFGPKDPSIYAPRGARTAVVWKQVYCAPCRLRRCGDPICMTTMVVDEAWEGVARVQNTAP
jgi:ADP-heptose:LPS heptosyltransferase